MSLTLLLVDFWHDFRETDAHFLEKVIAQGYNVQVKAANTVQQRVWSTVNNKLNLGVQPRLQQRRQPIFKYKEPSTYTISQLHFDSMPLLMTTLTAAIVAEHYYILWLEMFAWETKGPKVFRGTMPKDLFPKNHHHGGQPRTVQWIPCYGFVVEPHDWRPSLVQEHCDLLFWLCVCGGRLRGAFGSREDLLCPGSARSARPRGNAVGLVSCLRTGEGN